MLFVVCFQNLVPVAIDIESGKKTVHSVVLSWITVSFVITIIPKCVMRAAKSRAKRFL